MRKIFVISSLLVALIIQGETHLTRTGATQIPLTGRDIWVVDIGGISYAFVDAGEEGIKKINLSSYSVVASFNDAPIFDIWLRDSMVYAGGIDTFYILRQSNLAVVGKLRIRTTQSIISAVTVMDRISGSNHLFAYLGVNDTSNGHTYVYVCDVHNPSSPGWVTNMTTSTDLGTGYIYDIYALYGGERGIATCGSYYSSDGWPYLLILLREGSAPPFTYKFSLRRPTGNCGGYYSYYRYQSGNPAGALEDEYVLPDRPYSLWVAGHDGILYTYVANGTEGLYVFPTYPDTGAIDDIRDPIVAGWTKHSGDDFRDVYIFGDLGFLANYSDGTSGGGKMFYVLDLSNIELGDIDTTASIDGYFATGIWGDSLQVHVVADSIAP